MPRQARIVVPVQPHHVTHRGNRRAPIFFEPGDQTVYRNSSRETLRRDVAVWAYCLIANHVHLIMTPRTGDALRRIVMMLGRGRPAQSVDPPPMDLFS